MIEVNFNKMIVLICIEVICGLILECFFNVSLIVFFRFFVVYIYFGMGCGIGG